VRRPSCGIMCRMENHELEETQPLQLEANNSEQTPKKGKKRTPWGLIAIAGIVFLAIVAAISGFAGYNTGISLRTGAQQTQVVSTAKEQFELGVQDMSEGQYFRARQRFEYVIQLDPNYPDVTEKLAEVLLELNTTATPTVAPTPTLTPTPDLRGVEQLYSDGQQFLANGAWTQAIDTLLQLRKTDPNYHTVDIDGMLFIALRNRGWDKIVKEADLEGGIYDLNLASQFGPIDAEAQNMLTWASIYITGASFWELDWSQAVYYFGQVAPQLPGLRDGSGMTSTERYRRALIGYGDQLMAQGQYCDAREQYNLALSYGPDAAAEESNAEANKRCEGGSKDKPAEENQPAPTEAPPAPTEETQPTEPPPSDTPYPSP
jgi:tetratricopeptide (TPR) repeat protein